jgi:hypothetical protein
MESRSLLVSSNLPLISYVASMTPKFLVSGNLALTSLVAM